MSATMTSRPGTKNAVVREPRVQLLPPSVRERERARASMRLGVLVVVLGLVASAGLVGFGYLRQLSTVDALAQANNRTAELFAERAQYAEATQVATTIDQVLEAQIAVTSYEVDVSELLGLLRARLGAGMSIRQMTFTGQAPWGVPLTGEDVLAPPRMAVVELTIVSATIAEGTAYREALSTIPGYASAVLSSTAVGTDGGVTTQITLALATDAVAGRFVVDEADPEAAAAESAEG
jgi:hypothetical protein